MRTALPLRWELVCTRSTLNSAFRFGKYISSTNILKLHRWSSQDNGVPNEVDSFGFLLCDKFNQQKKKRWKDQGKSDSDRKSDRNQILIIFFLLPEMI